jgi:DNA-binding response OmpR family regulator
MEEKKRTVLLAEDDIFVSDIYNLKLQKEGFEVILVPDGREAVKRLETETPDLIMLDIMMPYMDGMDVLEAIKKEDRLKNIPVLMLTNLSEKENIEKAMKMGANDYLIKAHFTPSEVIGKVRALLA